jgi:hypothetical protein
MPLAVSSRATKQLCDPAVETIVFRALDKRPTRRFQSADELAAALGGLLRQPTACEARFPQNSRRAVTTGLVLLAGAAVACLALWSSRNSVAFSANDPFKQAASTTPAAPALQDEHQTGGNSARPVALAESIDDELAPFGVVPPGWSRVGALENSHHEIERSEVTLDGDFALALKVLADRAASGSFQLTLVGSGGSDDLVISAQKTNSWSDNESWEFHTQTGTVVRGLPVSSHTFSLKRQGDVFTLTADAVHRPDHSSAVLSTFAAGEAQHFKSIRLAIDGPAITLEHLRLHTGNPDTK